MSSDDLLHRRAGLQKDIDASLTKMKKVEAETERIIGVLDHTSEILEDIDRDFEEKTKLSKQDVSILFFAVALQVARQYLLKNYLNDRTIKQLLKILFFMTKKKRKENITEVIISTIQHMKKSTKLRSHLMPMSVLTVLYPEEENLVIV